MAELAEIHKMFCPKDVEHRWTCLTVHDLFFSSSKKYMSVYHSPRLQDVGLETFSTALNSSKQLCCLRLFVHEAKSLFESQSASSLKMWCRETTGNRPWLWSLAAAVWIHFDVPTTAGRKNMLQGDASEECFALHRLFFTLESSPSHWTCAIPNFYDIFYHCSVHWICLFYIIHWIIYIYINIYSRRMAVPG